MIEVLLKYYLKVCVHNQYMSDRKKIQYKVALFTPSHYIYCCEAINIYQSI